MKTTFRQRAARARMQGLTMVELMITLLIMAILMAVAIPSYNKVISDNRILSGTNTLAQAITFARSQAIKLGRPVTLCPSDNSVSCMASSPDFQKGWLVIVDQTSTAAGIPSLDASVAGGGVLMGGGEIQNADVVKAGYSWIRFLPRGVATEAVTMTVKPKGTCRTGYSWQQLEISIAGRISVTKKVC